jgi:hypothetical protein
MQDPHALAAWKIRVANLAMQESLAEWTPGGVNELMELP